MGRRSGQGDVKGGRCEEGTECWGMEKGKGGHGGRRTVGNQMNQSNWHEFGGAQEENWGGLGRREWRAGHSQQGVALRSHLARC